MHRQHTAIPLRLNIAIACISILISAWLIHNDPLINRDGITYLRTAEAYLNHGLIAAIQLFDRPFLSVISGELHRATSLSLAISAQLVVTSLYVTLCLAFVSTIGLLGGDRRTQIIAALIVLSHPVINGYRSDIMRDPGYWAMGVLAFRQLLLFLFSPHWQHQVLWFIYIVFAAFFRFEAVAYICLAPFAVAIVSAKGGRAEVLAGFGLLPLLTVFGILVFYALTNGSGYSTLALFEDIGGYVSKALVIPDFFLDEKAHASQDWVAEHSREDISIFLLSGTIGLLAINIIRSLTWPWLAVLCWGVRIRTKGNATVQQLQLLNIHILIAATYLFSFLLINHFMLERYAGFLTLLLLLYLPAIVDDQLNKGGLMAGILVSAIFIGMSADTLHNGNREKAYIKNATLWINRQLPHNATLFTNYSYIEYFSQLRKIPVPYSAKLQVEELLLEQSIWMSADYLVISVKNDEQEAWSKFVATFTPETINMFEGGRHGNLYIVKN